MKFYLEHPTSYHHKGFVKCDIPRSTDSEEEEEEENDRASLCRVPVNIILQNCHQETVKVDDQFCVNVCVCLGVLRAICVCLGYGGAVAAKRWWPPKVSDSVAVRVRNLIDGHACTLSGADIRSPASSGVVAARGRSRWRAGVRTVSRCLPTLAGLPCTT